MTLIDGYRRLVRGWLISGHDAVHNEAPGVDDEGLGGHQPELTFLAEFRRRQMPRVALFLHLSQGHEDLTSLIKPGD